LWLSGDAGKAARWLGYIDFEQIVDQRNAAPDVTRFVEPTPEAYLNVGLDVEGPDASEIWRDGWWCSIPRCSGPRSRRWWRDR
jgi:hypothetical protein